MLMFCSTGLDVVWSPMTVSAGPAWNAQRFRSNAMSPANAIGFVGFTFFSMMS